MFVNIGTITVVVSLLPDVDNLCTPCGYAAPSLWCVPQPLGQ